MRRLVAACLILLLVPVPAGAKPGLAVPEVRAGDRAFFHEGDAELRVSWSAPTPMRDAFDVERMAYAVRVEDLGCGCGDTSLLHADADSRLWILGSSAETAVTSLGPLPLVALRSRLPDEASRGVDVLTRFAGETLRPGDRHEVTIASANRHDDQVWTWTFTAVGWGRVQGRDAFRVDSRDVYGASERAMTLWFDGASPVPFLIEVEGGESVHLLAYVPTEGASLRTEGYRAPAEPFSRAGARRSPFGADGPTEALDLPLTPEAAARAARASAAAWFAAHPDAYLREAAYDDATVPTWNLEWVSGGAALEARVALAAAALGDAGLVTATRETTLYSSPPREAFAEREFACFGDALAAARALAPRDRAVVTSLLLLTAAYRDGGDVLCAADVGERERAEGDTLERLSGRAYVWGVSGAWALRGTYDGRTSLVPPEEAFPRPPTVELR